MARWISGAVRVKRRERLRRLESRSGSVKALCRLEGGSIGARDQGRRRPCRVGSVSSTASATGRTRPPPKKC
jgi:hypothetical protein